jgi:hypothetical protein
VIAELLIRFLIGGSLVSVFALLGDMFSPKTFAGLFAGAPSVALATMALTLHRDGAAQVAIEARSMAVGAVAFVFYAAFLSAYLYRHRARSAPAAVAWLPLWFVLAAVGFVLFVRAA